LGPGSQQMSQALKTLKRRATSVGLLPVLRSEAACTGGCGSRGHKYGAQGSLQLCGLQGGPSHHCCLDCPSTVTSVLLSAELMCFTCKTLGQDNFASKRLHMQALCCCQCAGARLAPLTGVSLRALAAQDAPRPDPRAAAKKAKVEALWAQLNGGAAAVCRAGTPGAAGAPAMEPLLAEPAPTATAGRVPAAGGLSLAALCRPLARQRATEDKDRARGPF